MFERVNRVISEVTTTANIAYLPSGFISWKEWLKRLADMKDRWNIKVLEKDSYYEVLFEDEAKAIVDKDYYCLFAKDFLGGMEGEGMAVIDLRKYLAEKMIEAVDEEMKKLKRELTRALREAVEKGPVGEMREDFDLWIKLFGITKILTPKSVVFPFEEMDKSLKVVLEKLFEAYEGDKGGLEMLIEALKNGDPMNAFEVFKEYDFLAGSRIRYVYKGEFVLVWEGLVNMDWSITESILIEDEKLLEEVSGHSDVKAVKNVVFPKGKRSFTKKFLDFLKRSMEELI